MGNKTALEHILMAAGYSLRRAQRCADWLDLAEFPGMNSDDLAAAFFRWRLSYSINDKNLDTLGGVCDKATHEALKQIEVIGEARYKVQQMAKQYGLFNQPGSETHPEPGDQATPDIFH